MSLGHSDIKTTMRYAHLSPAASSDAIAKLPY
jgi:integrase